MRISVFYLLNKIRKRSTAPFASNFRWGRASTPISCFDFDLAHSNLHVHSDEPNCGSCIQYSRLQRRVTDTIPRECCSLHRRAVQPGKHESNLQISHIVDFYGEYRKFVSPHRSVEHLDALKRVKGI